MAEAPKEEDRMSQPDPKPGREPVHVRLLERLEERRRDGLRNYGRPLETHNGRDALEDARDEAIDLSLYLTQWILERRTFDALLLDAYEHATFGRANAARECIADALAVLHQQTPQYDRARSTQ